MVQGRTDKVRDPVMRGLVRNDPKGRTIGGDGQAISATELRLLGSSRRMKKQGVKGGLVWL